MKANVGEKVLFDMKIMRIVAIITTLIAIMGCASQEQPSSLSVQCVPAIRTSRLDGDTIIGPDGKMYGYDKIKSELIISDRQRVYVFNWLLPPCELTPKQKYTFVLEPGGRSVQSIQDLEGKTIWKVNPKHSRVRVPLIRIEELDNVEQ